MANVLSDEKRQQVIALGRLNWPLRRIEAATGVRRETASAHLKAAGVPVRPERTRRPPKPASQVSTDSGGQNRPVVSTDSQAGAGPHPAAAPGSPAGPAPPSPPERTRAVH